MPNRSGKGVKQAKCKRDKTNNVVEYLRCLARAGDSCLWHTVCGPMTWLACNRWRSGWERGHPLRQLDSDQCTEQINQCSLHVQTVTRNTELKDWKLPVWRHPTMTLAPRLLYVCAWSQDILQVSITVVWLTLDVTSRLLHIHLAVSNGTVGFMFALHWRQNECIGIIFFMHFTGKLLLHRSAILCFSVNLCSHPLSVLLAPRGGGAPSSLSYTIYASRVEHL